MKSVVDAKSFAAAVGRVMGMLRNSLIPQLTQVRVQFAGDVCKVSATDLTAWLSTDTDAKGDDFAFVFRNTKKAERILRHYDGELTVELLDDKQNRRILLHCGDKAGELPVYEDEDFGGIPAFAPFHSYAVKPDVLYDRVKNVSYATRQREDRPICAAVRFDDKRVWCVDGYRMAVHEDASLDVRESFALPVAALKHLKVFGAADGVLAVGEKHASLSTDSLTLTCALIERTDELRVETVLPKSCGETYTVKRKAFLEALNYLADCTNTSEEIRVVFDQGKLLIDGKHGKFQASVGEIEGKCEVRYAFNLAYMKQAVEQFSGAEEIHVGTTNAISPIVLTEGSKTAMVLPVRMREEPRRQAA